MSNGFNYESPLNAFLSKGLPQIISEVSRKQERRETREYNDKWKLREWNENQRRYDESVRRADRVDDLNFDSIMIERASKMTLPDQQAYLNKLVETGKIKSTKGYDLLESVLETSRGKLATANDLVTGLDVYNLSEFEYRQVESQYKSGKFNDGFNSLINIIDRKLKASPEQMLRAKNLSAERKKITDTLIDPLSKTLYNPNDLAQMQKDKDRIDAEIAEIFSGASIYKGQGGGAVDSTDYGLYQINDKTWNKTSQDMFGKDARRLTPEQNIKMASWIVKNSPRTVGGSTSGWNNWSVVLNNSYKQHMNKPDSYYMKGGLSKSNLALINKEFGDDAPMAKAVMMAESGGKHSAMNQNLSRGGSRAGKTKTSSPFSVEWNAEATQYLTRLTGLSPQDFNRIHGKKLVSWINKLNRPGITNKRAQAELEKFGNRLKGSTGIVQKLRVPTGKHRGKKLNKAVVEDLLKERRASLAERTKVTGRSIFGRGDKHEWLDTFANQLGFANAEDLLTKEGIKAMNNFYKKGDSVDSINKIDFSKPFEMSIE
jgi:hypothetical protein